MSERARVDSIDAIKQFKIALWKFQEAANAALGDAEGEMQRMMVWLENEQQAYWTGQIRKRHDAVEKAKEAVRYKKIFRDSTGSLPTAIEEEKALALARRRLAEAEEKLANVKRYTRVLQKEIQLYHGSVQRLATSVQSDIPAAAAHLENLTAKLDAYVSLTPGQADSPTTGLDSGESMSRPAAAIEAGSLQYASPDKHARAAAVSWTDGELPLPSVTLEDEQRKQIASLAAEPQPPDLDAVVVFAPVDSEENLYLHRLPTDAAGDTGWYLGPADGSLPPTLWTVFLKTLLDQRPQLRELLALPPKFSAIMDGGGVVAVWDDRGRRVGGR